MPVEGAPQLASNWEALVQQRQEVAAQLGGHGGAVGWVEPDYSASSAPPPCFSPPSSGLRLVDQLLLVAGPLERLDIGTLGGVEDFLIGGKERQPLADLRHGVLGDVPGMVGVHVYVLQVGQGLHVGPVHLVDQVQSDVEEVCHPGVGGGFYLEIY